MLNPTKTIQASVILLKQNGNRMSRMRLLKLLYIADRISLKTIGQTITGDHPVAMKNGPVLTRTYNLIKGCDTENAVWDRYLKRNGSQDIEMIQDPGIDDLSQFEIETLIQVANEFLDHDDWDVAEATHQFPEWIKNKPAPDTSKPIPMDDILEALGLMQYKSVIETEAKVHARADQIFG